ncbi:hypothetical protein [Kocuria rhizophila]|nr:hypothetical protein [Kocuria rhizophila]
MLHMGTESVVLRLSGENDEDSAADAQTSVINVIQRRLTLDVVLHMA